MRWEAHFQLGQKHDSFKGTVANTRSKTECSEGGEESIGFPGRKNQLNDIIHNFLTLMYRR